MPASYAFLSSTPTSLSAAFRLSVNSPYLVWRSVLMATCDRAVSSCVHASAQVVSSPALRAGTYYIRLALFTSGVAPRGSVTASARALYVHPNTVRQRLERIERVAELDLPKEDLLSLELALKLARLHQARAERE